MAKVLCIGYQCFCGAKVTVVRLARVDDIAEPIPAKQTVSCSQGHVATVSANQFAALEHWEEDVGEAE